MTLSMNESGVKRHFNISMQSFTIEAKDHFDAGMQFFNFHKGIGMLWIQEMKGAEKIGNPINIRNTFQTHDEEIMKAVELALEEPSKGTVQIIKDLLEEAKLDKNKDGYF